MIIVYYYARIFHSNKVDDGCKRKQRKDSLSGVQPRTTIAIIRIAGAHKLPTVFMHSCFLANVHCGIHVSALANNANLNSTLVRKQTLNVGKRMSEHTPITNLHEESHAPFFCNRYTVRHQEVLHSLRQTYQKPSICPLTCNLLRYGASCKRSIATT